MNNFNKNRKIFLLFKCVFKHFPDDFFDEKDSKVKELWINITASAFFCTAGLMSSEMKKIIKSNAVLDDYMVSIGKYIDLI